MSTLEIDIDFREQGNSAAYVLDGWGDQEPGHRWSIGRQSLLRLPIARRGVPHVLVLDVKPWLHPPRLESQTVVIGVNERLIGTIGIPREGVFGFVVDARHTRDSALVVSIDHLDAAEAWLNVCAMHCCSASDKEGKQFFFEKKNQKTFITWVYTAGEGRDSIQKSLLLLFFRKEGLSFNIPQAGINPHAMTVRTRFAPSPTGLLHIGGARTALFNYLFARHHGGAFLLRIEDTDRARSTQQAVDVILQGLAWLGLEPDETPVFQSSRAARHADIAAQLLEAGRAYRCWATPDELRTMRERATAEGRPPRYDGRWRDRDPAEAPAGLAPAIRLRVPQQGETVIDDLVQGQVRVANAELDDMIILRGDGTPTYLHAVVVDDHDMEITHVIRGDDHLTNTFRQAQIFDALDWPRPRFAHIPLIHGADGAKLSKRHGAVSVLEFEREGFLSEALCNYLLRLGWGHGDAEILSRDQAIALFDLDGVGRAASRMDYAKLTHLNGVWLRQADDRRLTQEVMRRLELHAGTIAEHRIAALMPGLKERAKTLVDLAESASFLARPEPLAMDSRAAALLTQDARAVLAELLSLLEQTPFDQASLDAALRAFAERTGRKLGTLAQPLRAALTGTTTSPGIDAVLAALGRDTALRRIRDCA